MNVLKSTAKINREELLKSRSSPWLCCKTCGATAAALLQDFAPMDVVLQQDESRPKYVAFFWK